MSELCRDSMLCCCTNHLHKTWAMWMNIIGNTSWKLCWPFPLLSSSSSRGLWGPSVYQSLQHPKVFTRINLHSSNKSWIRIWIHSWRSIPVHCREQNYLDKKWSLFTATSSGILGQSGWLTAVRGSSQLPARCVWTVASNPRAIRSWQLGARTLHPWLQIPDASLVHARWLQMLRSPDPREESKWVDRNWNFVWTTQAVAEARLKQCI